MLPAHPTHSTVAPGSRQHMILLELLHVDAVQAQNLLLHMKMRKSAVSTLITRNHIYSNLNSILVFQKSMKKSVGLAVKIWPLYTVCQVLLLKRNTRKKHGPTREHLIHLRWYEKSEWIFFARAKPCGGGFVGETASERLEVDYWFPFLFLGQRNGRLMGWDIYLDPFHSDIIRF